MKKMLFLIVLMMPAAAMAQTANSGLNSFLSTQLTQLGSSAANGSLTRTTGVESSSDMSVQQFNSLKSQIMQKVNSRISQLQSEQRCGQAAQTPESLNSCFGGDTQMSSTTTTTTTINPAITNNMTSQGMNALTQMGTQYMRR